MAVQSPSLSRGTQGCSMRPPSSAAIGRLPEAATVSTGQNLTKTSAPRGASAAQPREEVATEIPPVTTQTEKATKISLDGLYLCRRRPTLPHTFACSTIGPAGLDFRVRDGNGYFPRGKITGFVDVDAVFRAARPLSVVLSLDAGPVTSISERTLAAFLCLRFIRVDPCKSAAEIFADDLSQLNSIRLAWLKPCPTKSRRGCRIFEQTTPCTLRVQAGSFSSLAQRAEFCAMGGGDAK